MQQTSPPYIAALLDELTVLSKGQLMNNELVPSTLNRNFVMPLPFFSSISHIASIFVCI